jgi:formamidopyrimidine-DNA glycosylase
MRRLYRSLIEVLHDAVKHRGSSIGDAGFADLAGKPGEHQEHLQVYGRDGKLSPRSRTPIKKVKYDGHWTYFCDTQV